MNTPPNLQRPSGAASEHVETAATEVPKSRPVTRDKRRPFGSQTQKLAYEQRAGYHRHWFNDDPGRIHTALEAGYTHVVNKEGKNVQRVVGVNPAGGALMGFLMEIPEEWFQEDMARGQELVAKMDQAIKSGAVAGQPGQDGRYIPESRGIKITSGR